MIITKHLNQINFTVKFNPNHTNEWETNLIYIAKKHFGQEKIRMRF